MLNCYQDIVCLSYWMPSQGVICAWWGSSNWITLVSIQSLNNLQWILLIHSHCFKLMNPIHKFVDNILKIVLLYFLICQIVVMFWKRCLKVLNKFFQRYVLYVKVKRMTGVSHLSKLNVPSLSFFICSLKHAKAN